MQPSFGFGGNCLPKELQTVAAPVETLGLAMYVTAAASAANASTQDRFADRVVERARRLLGRTIGMLGLAFKAGTDDVRDSPAVRLAARLLADGAGLFAPTIPPAGPNAAAAVPGLVVVVDQTRGSVVRRRGCRRHRDRVAGVPRPAVGALDRPTSARPLVIDGRRLLDASALRSLGWTVIQLGDGRERAPAEPAAVPGT